MTLAALVLLAPAGAAAQRVLDVRATPARVVLGETRQVRITVRGAGALRAVANVGTVSGVSGGSATYTPPDGRQPRVAVILVYGDGVAGAVAIPLVGKTDLPVTTEPNALVTLEAGGRSFGPVRADDRGRATIPIELPPGIRTGTVVARDPAGNETRRPAQLGVEDEDRTLAVRTGADLVAGGEETATVAFAAAGPQGALLAGASATCEGPEIVGQRGGPGVVVARVRAGIRAGRFPVQGQFAGARATVAVHVRPGPPDRVVVTADPVRVPADGRTKARVRAAVVDRHANEIEGPPPTLRVEGAEVVEQDHAGSVATALVGARSLDGGRPPAPARIHAEGSGVSGDLDLPWFDPDAMTVEVTFEPAFATAGDPGPVKMIVVARDGSGRAPQSPALGISADGLDLPATVAHQSGEATLEFAPGTAARRHRVHVHAADAEGEGSFEVRAGPPVRIDARFEPSRVGPGERTRLVARVVDRFGNPVADTRPTAEPGPLRIGPMSADGSAPVEVPASLDVERVLQTVTAGDLRGEARLTIVRASAVYAGAAVGFAHNFGEMVAVPLAIEAGWRPPLAGRPLSLGLQLRWSTASGDASVTNAGQVDFEEEHLSMLAAVSWRWPVSRIEPFVGGSGGVALVRSRVTPTIGAVDERSSVEPAFEIDAGAEIALGPGRLRLSAGYGYLLPPLPLEGNAAGLVFFLGYRFDL